MFPQSNLIVFCQTGGLLQTALLYRFSPTVEALQRPLENNPERPSTLLDDIKDLQGAVCRHLALS